MDVAWCAACRSALAGPPWRCEQRAGRLDLLDGRPPLPVWTLADNVGAVRHAIVAWKDGGRLDLTRPLAADVARAARSVAPHVPRSRPGPLVVAAVPSTAGARRRRGGWLVDELARAAVAALREEGVDVRRAPVLRRRGGRDQAGLGARARARNLVGQLRVARGADRVLGGRDVVLVDDVLTTGASVAASAAAVRAAGGVVVACLTVASTPGPGTGGVAR
ncbi:ComF family protein [Cellulomonas sp. H30R-01]|uniref:ComF family protein n=1 Tax=Cellulomonas sp. H30R-01 TaxID=2704467 RepID=UPI001EE4472E|nr:ComF family protein [Cellulomonas sp. H30R-01]